MKGQNEGKEHLVNYSNLSEYPEDILECMFSFLKKRDVKSTALTCIRFSKIFARPNLRAQILKNISIDYHDMHNGQLQATLFQKQEHAEIILRIVLDRLKVGALDYSMLRSFIASCSLQTLYKFGRFFQFSEDSPQLKEEFLCGLLEKVVGSAEYYSGRPEYTNPHFISLTENLARIDIENLWKIPKLVENSISLFQYAYLSLPDNSTEKANLKELFDGFFVINKDNENVLSLAK